MTEIQHPYVPTPIWREIHQHPARYKVVVAGRRGGKSTGLLNHTFQISATKPSAKSWLVGPCYDDQTEILTDSGWKLFEDLEKDDMVGSVVDNELVFVVPTRYHKRHGDGYMVGYKGTQIDMVVTADHRCYTKSKYEKDFNIKTALEINGKWDYKFKKNVEWQGEVNTTKTLDWWEFLGFWFAEGCARVRERYGGEVVVSQTTYIDYTEDLLKRNNFPIKKSKKTSGFNYYIHDRELATELVRYGKAVNKAIPRYVFSLTKEEISSFLHGYWMGDGWYPKSSDESKRASTMSKQLANDIQELIIRVGGSCNISNDNRNGIYMLTWLNPKHNEPKTNKKYWHAVDYNGYIYCVEVPSGLVMVRRNGKHYICGNTFQQMKDIYWYDEKMKMYITPEVVEKKNESEMLIKLVNKSIMQFKGAERPDQLVGSGLDFLGMDEVAKIKSWHIVWEQNLRPALADRNGSSIFISTTQGKNHFYDLYDYGLNSGDPDWAVWKVPTWESGAPWTLTVEGKKFLDNERLRMTEDTFMQEYGAEFRQFAGLIFKDFDSSIHVEEFEVNEKYGMENGMDFGNPKPTAYIFSYFDNDDDWWIFDEHYKLGSIMIDHVGEILATRNKYHNKLRWTIGDSAAKQQIQECSAHGLYVTPVNKFNNSIAIGIDRIAERMKVNAVTRKPTIHIHPRCINLISELEKYKWKEERSSGSYQGQPEDEDNHAIDAIRYIILHHRRKMEEKKLVVGRKYKPMSFRDSI